jgi:hypothetical protein
MSAVALLPVVLLSSSMLVVPRTAVLRLLMLATVVPVVMAAISPAIAIVIFREGVSNYATHYRLIAHAVEQAWAVRTHKPLRIVGSYTNIVNGVVFYLSDKPKTFDIMSPQTTPWVDDSGIRRDGIALVCPVPEAACMQVLDARTEASGNAVVTEVSIARTFLGFTDHAVRYRIAIIPPAKESRSSSHDTRR